MNLLSTLVMPLTDFWYWTKHCSDRLQSLIPEKSVPNCIHTRCRKLAPGVDWVACHGFWHFSGIPDTTASQSSVLYGTIMIIISRLVLESVIICTITWHVHFARNTDQSVLLAASVSVWRREKGTDTADWPDSITSEQLVGIIMSSVSMPLQLK